MKDNSLFIKSAVVIAGVILTCIGCSSTPSTTANNPAPINKPVIAEEKTKINLLSIVESKEKQPFQGYYKGPVENKGPDAGRSFVIIDFELVNLRYSNTSVGFWDDAYALEVNDAITPSTVYVWNNAGYQTSYDGTPTKKTTGYWHVHGGGSTNLKGNQARNMRVMFEVLDNPGNKYSVLINGKKYSLK